jgi:hypothetical protein
VGRCPLQRGQGDGAPVAALRDLVTGRALWSGAAANTVLALEAALAVMLW